MLGDLVKVERKKLGLTQKALADRVGVGHQYIGHIENNSPKHKPSKYVVSRIMQELNLDDTDPMVVPYKPNYKYTTLIIPKPTVKVFDDYPIFKCDSFLASSDWHIPSQNSEFATNILTLALEWNVKVVSVGGDFATFSNFARFNALRDRDFGEEIDGMRAILNILTNEFEVVSHKQGNHEARLLDRVLKNQVVPKEFGRFISDSSNFHTTEYWYVAFHTPEGRWMTAHPENTSVYAGKIARDLEESKFADHNVITEHCHTLGVTKNKDGRYWCISSGMVGDPRRLDYYMFKANKGSAMQEGAIIVKDGQPWILTPDTNFDVLRNVYK